MDWKWVKVNNLQHRLVLDPNMLRRPIKNLVPQKTLRNRTFSHKRFAEVNPQCSHQAKNLNRLENWINLLVIKMIRIRKTFLPKKARREFWSTKLLSQRERWQTKFPRLLQSRDLMECDTHRRSKLEIWTVTQFWKLNSCHFRQWELQRVAFKSVKCTKDKKQRCQTATSRINKMFLVEFVSRLALMSWMECSRIQTSTLCQRSKSCRCSTTEKMYWK